MKSDLAQYIGVAIALIISVVWIIRRIISRRRGDTSKCGSCPDDCFCDLKELKQRKKK